MQSIDHFLFSSLFFFMEKTAFDLVFYSLQRDSLDTSSETTS